MASERKEWLVCYTSKFGQDVLWVGADGSHCVFEPWETILLTRKSAARAVLLTPKSSYAAHVLHVSFVRQIIDGMHERMRQLGEAGVGQATTDKAIHPALADPAHS